MLPQRDHHEILPQKLSVSANNFPKYDELWRTKCAYSFGKSGEQLRENQPIPLKTSAPDRNALRLHTVSEQPIKGQYVYKREPIPATHQRSFADLTEEEQTVIMDNQPLTDPASEKFDRDTAANTLELDTQLCTCFTTDLDNQKSIFTET